MHEEFDDRDVTNGPTTRPRVRRGYDYAIAISYGLFDWQRSAVGLHYCETVFHFHSQTSFLFCALL